MPLHLDAAIVLEYDTNIETVRKPNFCPMKKKEISLAKYKIQNGRFSSGLQPPLTAVVSIHFMTTDKVSTNSPSSLRKNIVT